MADVGAPPSGDKTKMALLTITFSSFFFFSHIQDLVNNGALVSICNKYGEMPMDKAKPELRELLRGNIIAC